ncbi:latrophilin Cirl-like isoform X2 [Artemia franciscana]|uniref:latrophilin Cirl-like isoform X2 n=1 Tax=Artemia franciscana TaxID=6661 RepID=UPI0032D9C584
MGIRSSMRLFCVFSVLLNRSSLQVSTLSTEQKRYSTAYACEGTTLELRCEPSEVISLVRANYGRFSITICNEHGDTDWSVNCMSHKSLRVLHSRCGQQTNCTILASSSTFGDACPGTLKYLEVQYQCVSATTPPPTTRPRPPWFNSPIPSVWNPPSRNDAQSRLQTTTETTTTTTISPTTTTVLPTLPSTPSKNESIPIFVENVEGVTVPVPEIPGKYINKKGGWQRIDEGDATIPPMVEAETTTVELTPLQKEIEIIQPEPINTVPADTSNMCLPGMMRGLFWNWTKGGEVAIQPCPGGATGYARWLCYPETELAQAHWVQSTPDLSECKSVWLTSLESRIAEGDSLISVANELSQVTNSKTLYGGDMVAASNLLKKLALKMAVDLQAFPDWRQREAIVTELVQSIVQAGSTLLEPGQYMAWRDLGHVFDTDDVLSDLSRDQHSRVTATSLLTGLEENAFLLANTIMRPKTVVQDVENILLTVKVLETRYIEEMAFPGPEEKFWNGMEDSILLPAEALLENSESGLVRIVVFAFNHLEQILGAQEELSPETLYFRKVRHGNTTRIVNSRVLSASLGKGRHIQLPQPVTLTFRHLQTENVSNPSCVFWDYTVSAWSEEGCRVSLTNKTHTMCRCDHLTHFAVLMDLRESPLMASHNGVLTTVTYIGIGISIIFLALAFLTFVFCQGLKCERTTIHKHLCFCLLVGEIIFIAGIGETWQPVLCGVVAGLLQYFFLAAFMWLLLDGLQIYISLVHLFEAERSKLRWYYLTGYGVPIVIVAIACIVDPLSYGSHRHCWLREENYFILSFVGPAILILLANTVFLILASVVVCRHRLIASKSKDQPRSSYAASWLRGAFILTFLSGSTWTFGLLFLYASKIVVAYLFTTFIILQGLFIYVYYCLQNEKVRKEYRRMLGLTPLANCMNQGENNSKPVPNIGLYNQQNTNTITSTTGLTAHNTAPFLQHSWSGLVTSTGGTLRCGPQQTLMPAVVQYGGHHNPQLDNENYSSFKCGSRDSGHGGSEQEDSPRTVIPGVHHQTLSLRGTNPKARPNPALSENAALDAQLIAKFCNGSETILHGHPIYHRTQRRLRAQSPWNHTYSEIDGRRAHCCEESELDPVYEEIERRECHCYSHLPVSSDVSDERCSSDVSRQSSRSYGDNRPLLPAHLQCQPELSPERDLLMTMNCAFGSPHLKTRHRHSERRIEHFHHGGPFVEVPHYAAYPTVVLPNGENAVAIAVLNGDRVLCQVQPSGQLIPVHTNQQLDDRTLPVSEKSCDIPQSEC